MGDLGVIFGDQDLNMGDLGDILISLKYERFWRYCWDPELNIWEIPVIF